MTPRPTVCVVLHDVADATLTDCERMLRAVEEVAPLPLTLLAVPHYHGQPATASLEAWLGERCRAGDELALHGFTHRDSGTPRGPLDWLRRRFYTRGEGEFWALSADQARLRLAAGVAWFDRQGWPLQGFVAPAWLLGPGGWQALRASNRFSYTSTLQQIHALRADAAPRCHRSRSVVYSSASAWRRQASVAWARINLAGLRHNPLLRLELHPADARHTALRRSWQHALEAALRGREPSTVADWARRWQPSPPDPAGSTPTAPARQAAIADAADGSP